MNNSMTVLLVQILAIGAVFYFLIIRPQSAARKKAEEMRASLKKGDDVTTSGGIVGIVKDVKENLVTVESGSSSFVVERTHIVRIGKVTAPGS